MNYTDTPSPQPGNNGLIYTVAVDAKNFNYEYQ
ncbi:hypothetical protein SAMN05444168_4928 [Paraburkholderia phenazinium]|uniref:Uncharacterized protein n=1 Tax=Paraburkholderia phenazinium TaxID=60549 RepID=A0A1N6JT25_9BURK|nr:hypothetical protein SAMN05444168_4928 [Paraburkholderia phenazinium]